MGEEVMEHGERATYERLKNLCEQVVEALRQTRFASATVSLSPRDGGHEIEFRTSTAMPPETEARIAALEAERDSLKMRNEAQAAEIERLIPMVKDALEKGRHRLLKEGFTPQAPTVRAMNDAIRALAREGEASGRKNWWRRWRGGFTKPIVRQRCCSMKA